MLNTNHATDLMTKHTSSEKIKLQEVSVSISNLTKLYHKTGKKEEQFIVANENISLDIYRGEIFGLLGPNGAGKTTLVNQMLGLVKPDSGSVKIEGIDVFQRPHQIKKFSSYLPQQSVDFGSLEVQRILIYTGELRGQKKAEAKAQAQHLIKTLDLKEVADQYFDRLSGGMQRVVNLAIAFMGYPKLLVLDEPTNELDPARRQVVWNFLRSTLRDTGSTCILVTHSLIEAAPVLDRVAVMYQGRIIALGTPGSLKQAFSNQARLDLTFKPEFLTLGQERLQHLLAATNLAGLVKMEDNYSNPHNKRLFLPQERADEVLSLLIHQMGLAYLDDWHMALPSLEDVYLELVKGEHE